MCNGYPLSALHNQYILINFSALCAFHQLFLVLDRTKSYVEKKHSKNQGSPMWCPRAPGCLQGPSSSSAGIGVARGTKWHGTQISSISCCFVLWGVLSQTKYCCSLKVKIFGPKKISGWLPSCSRACSKNYISMISVFPIRNIFIVNTKIIKVNWATFLIYVKLVALCINWHARSSSQLQESWRSLLQILN